MISVFVIVIVIVKIRVSVEKFSREFSANYHRKGCKVSSEGENSLENFVKAIGEGREMNDYMFNR